MRPASCARWALPSNSRTSRRHRRRKWSPSSTCKRSAVAKLLARSAKARGTRARMTELLRDRLERDLAGVSIDHAVRTPAHDLLDLGVLELLAQPSGPGTAVSARLVLDRRVDAGDMLFEAATHRGPARVLVGAAVAREEEWLVVGIVAGIPRTLHLEIGSQSDDLSSLERYLPCAGVGLGVLLADLDVAHVARTLGKMHIAQAERHHLEP